jgi:hypothetical protein
MAEDTAKKPKLVPPNNAPDEAVSIAKPNAFDLDKFKSTQSTALANVETLLPGLPHHTIKEAKDFVRLHPDEATYWSVELCFVNVPIQGQKRDTLHLIMEELAMRHLPNALIQRFRLALATKPYDKFFLCHVPTRNLDNKWNETNLSCCTRAKTHWIMAASLYDSGVEGYKGEFSRDPDAFPSPKWPTETLGEMIGKAFDGRIIDHEAHPGLLRLIGAKQQMS